MTIRKQPTVAELAARHTQHEVPANIPAPRPGLPLSGLSGPSGIRTGGSIDAWNRKLRLLDF